MLRAESASELLLTLIRDDYAALPVSRLTFAEYTGLAVTGAAIPIADDHPGRRAAVQPYDRELPG